VGQVAGEGEAQSGCEGDGTAVDLVCGVQHMGSTGDGGEADSCSWSQGVLTVEAADHVGGMDDMAVQALGDETVGEGGGQGGSSMAAHVPGAGVGKVGGTLAWEEQDEGYGEQGGASVAEAGAEEGLDGVEQARSTAEAHGLGGGQDREAVDQSGIEPAHVQVEGIC